MYPPGHATAAPGCETTATAVNTTCVHVHRFAPGPSLAGGGRLSGGATGTRDPASRSGGSNPDPPIAAVETVGYARYPLDRVPRA